MPDLDTQIHLNMLKGSKNRGERRMVMDENFVILAENLTIMPHAGIIHFTKPADDELLKKQTYTQA